MTALVVSGRSYTDELCDSRNRFLIGLSLAAMAGAAACTGVAAVAGVAALGTEAVGSAATTPTEMKKSMIAVFAMALSLIVMAPFFLTSMEE